MRVPKITDYPKQIQIGDAIYKIKFVARIGNSRTTLGICDPSDYIIRIKKGMTKEETFATLIHELLHAFEAEYDINISHKAVYQLEQAISILWLTL